TETLRLAAEDPAAGRVEGEDPEPAPTLAEQALEPLAHLARGLVREGDREDLVRLCADSVDEVRDAVREDTRLPRAGAGDDEQRAFRGEDGLALRRVEVGEVLLRRRDGHAADASGALGRTFATWPENQGLTLRGVSVALPRRKCADVSTGMAVRATNKLSLPAARPCG